MRTFIISSQNRLIPLEPSARTAVGWNSLTSTARDGLTAQPANSIRTHRRGARGATRVGGARAAPRVRAARVWRGRGCCLSSVRTRLGAVGRLQARAVCPGRLYRRAEVCLPWQDCCKLLLMWRSRHSIWLFTCKPACALLTSSLG